MLRYNSSKIPGGLEVYTTPIGMLFENEADAENLRDRYIEAEGPGFDFRVVTLSFPEATNV